MGLITGWMSGRLHVPPALERRNVLTDPVAIQWQVRFVRAFVRRFREHAAILAWDLGNECNCMAEAGTREAAWAWAWAIAAAARVEDPSRPVVSGMHGLLPDERAPWRIQDQGELTDVLTTHPYPFFTPHCDQDPVTSIRTILHSTAESRLYADIGGRPCLAEETGTLGPMVASDTASARFLRAALFSLWAHDCHGLLWWCAFDQDHLAHAPYEWHAYERELGLFRADGTARPVVKELGAFRRFLDSLPYSRLPPRLTQAVCILSRSEPRLGITEHPLDERRRVAVLINYGADDMTARVAVKSGWSVETCRYGLRPTATSGSFEVHLEGCDACVLELTSVSAG